VTPDVPSPRFTDPHAPGVASTYIQPPESTIPRGAVAQRLRAQAAGLFDVADLAEALIAACWEVTEPPIPDLGPSGVSVKRAFADYEAMVDASERDLPRFTRIGWCQPETVARGGYVVGFPCELQPAPAEDFPALVHSLASGQQTRCQTADDLYAALREHIARVADDLDRDPEAHSAQADVRDALDQLERGVIQPHYNFTAATAAPTSPTALELSLERPSLVVTVTLEGRLRWAGFGRAIDESQRARRRGSWRDDSHRPPPFSEHEGLERVVFDEGFMQGLFAIAQLDPENRDT
jgi:hypothetical protein